MTESVEGFSKKERENFDIVYYPQKESNISSSSASLVRQVLEGADVSQLDVSFKKIQKENRDYYIITLPGNDGEETKLFVKKNNKKRNKDGGVVEFEAGQKAINLLKENNINGAEVVDYLFAFDNHKTGDNYIVSKYNSNLSMPVSKYLETLRGQIGDDYDSASHESVLALQEKESDLRHRIAQIKNLLSNEFYDVTEDNMAYDEDRDMIILFDLNNKISSPAFYNVPDDEL